jgi:D-arabinose 1-dehydrogenase-like Zn-dependent alcohol dehydrogenase
MNPFLECLKLPRRAYVAVLTAPQRLHFEERDIPGPFPADTLLAETLVSAISPGTELAAWQGLPPLSRGPAYPRLMGYCNVARVLYCGESCTGVKPGDRILSFSSHCSHFVLRSCEVLAVLPPDLGSEQAVTAYLFHLGYSAVLAAAQPPGATAAVLGLGVLGLTSCAMANLAGWQVAAVTDQSPVLSLPGLRFHRRDDPPAPASFQVVIVTSGSWQDWDLALRLASQRAQIIVLGFPGRGTPTVPFNPLRPEDFYQRQLRITAAGMCPEYADSRGFCAFNERSNITRIFDWFLSGQLDPTTLLRAPCRPANQLSQLYESLGSSHRSAHTYLLDWQSSTFQS